MWVVGLITFFMSAVLDNLTTTIVMVSLVKKVAQITLTLIIHLIDWLADCSTSSYLWPADYSVDLLLALLISNYS